MVPILYNSTLVCVICVVYRIRVGWRNVKKTTDNGTEDDRTDLV